MFNPLGQTLFMKQVAADVNLYQILLILLQFLQTDRTLDVFHSFIKKCVGQTLCYFRVNCILLPAN